MTPRTVVITGYQVIAREAWLVFALVRGRDVEAAGLDRELLEELSTIRSTGILVYLATNQEHRRAQHLMKTLGLAEHVDGIRYSAQVGAKKPSRDFFDHVASTMGFPTAELLLVDDMATMLYQHQEGFECLGREGDVLFIAQQ